MRGLSATLGGLLLLAVPAHSSVEVKVERSWPAELIGAAYALSLSSTAGGPLTSRLAAGATGHAAVRDIAALVRAGKGPALGALALHCPSASKLAACKGAPDSVRVLLGGPRAVDGLHARLSAFESDSAFAAALAGGRPALEAALAAARREAAAGPDAAAVAAWLREDEPVTVRMVVVSGAPAQYASAAVRVGERLVVQELRPQDPDADGRASFGLAEPARSPAHRAAAALIGRHWPPLSGSGGPPVPPGCPAPWDECLRAHAALAAVLAAQTPVKAALLRGRLKPESFPLLDAAAAAWRPFASDSRRRLADFVPELQRALLAAAPEGARAALSPAGRRQDDPPSAGSAAALERAAAGDWPGALAAAEAAVAADPKDVGSWVNCGVVAARLKMGARAHRCFASALSWRETLFPEDGELFADILSSRASLHEAEGRPDLARGDLERALRAGGSRWARGAETRQRLTLLKDSKPDPGAKP